MDYLLEDLAGRRISGAVFCTLHADRMDARLRALAEIHLAPASGITLMALGGYGRRELCPFSDIDLMFFAREPLTEAQNAAIEKFLYAVWDTGAKVGHAVRTMGDCLTLSLKDSKILTSLLDCRVVHGTAEMRETLRAHLLDNLTAQQKKQFVQDKLAERDERHARYGDTRYVLEPNIKEGKGGLRDFQTLLWITNVLYGAGTLDDLAARDILTAQEARRFAKSHDFLLNIRCHLHEIAGRAEERLHFDIQPDLAERLGYTSRHTGRAVERFMKHYFLITRDIGDMTRILLAAIEHEEHPDARSEAFLGFERRDGRLMFGKAHKLSSNPVDMLRLFRVSQEFGIDIHPYALTEITRNLRHIDDGMRNNPQANDIFLDILTAPKDAVVTLRRLNESGVLGRFIPDFARIIALMQFDRYHYFTVDEHILRCIAIFHKMLRGDFHTDAPMAATVTKKLDAAQSRALFVALFLHDIAKGRGGRHAELGADIALMLCPRFGLSGEDTDLISWLVLEHLLMSDTAFRRNLNDPKTIADFSARIRSPERLDLLFVLTTVDIMGVGPGRWTAWKARLLEELYNKTRALMMGEEPGMMEEITLPPDLAAGDTRIDIETDEAQSATRIIVYTPDRPGLFATLCGALSAEGANIMRAYINTVEGSKGSPRIAVDRFIVQNASFLPFRQERRREDLRQSILGALGATLDIDARIATFRRAPSKKDSVFDIPPRIALNNDASGSDTVVEIETRDRHGLLYDIACTFRDQGLDIRAAKINTQGLRVIDSFYIQTAKRRKLTDFKAQERLVESLKAVVAKP